ncbi:uncharacterized protein RB166_002633 [Leptodactylus fuscus]|uniref:uncharacterized protein LOC142195372 n=1 Tax=Leptodactylus fuscus TaxID=238119 RepID=UPI003F4EC356
MKSAVFIVCLIGMACILPASNADSSLQDSSESHSKSISDSHPDSSSSSEEKFRTTPSVDGATAQSIVTNDFARGDNFRRRRALRSSSESSHQDTNSVESHSLSKSDSSSEEVSIAPTPNAATAPQTRVNSLRRRRSLNQVAHGSSSHHSEESVPTESTSHQSHPTESSEENSQEDSIKKNLLQSILSMTTADPDTSEESSEEKTTPVFEP